MAAELLQPPVGWTQPFRWGLLTVLDPGSAWELPDLEAPGGAHATATCVTASVLHASDVEVFEGWPDDLPLPLAQVDVVIATSEAPPGSQVDLDRELTCPSGHLEIGDAESARLVNVVPGVVRVQMSLFPQDHAAVVVLRLLPRRPR